jgi:hypothetical protein
MMEAVRTSETSFTRCNIPEYSHLNICTVQVKADRVPVIGKLIAVLSIDKPENVVNNNTTFVPRPTK